MATYLINPNRLSYGIGVVTPRWLFVLAGATPAEYGDPVIVDETLRSFDPEAVRPGDVVGIGIHTGNALRGYQIGRAAHARGARVVFGGIHATLYPEEARELGCADAVVRGDGDRAWGTVLADCARGTPAPVYEGGPLEAGEFARARWDLLPDGGYMWATVQTLRGCPKHCSFCSVWRTDGQRPRQRAADAVMDELIDLRQRGFRFIVLADDNFYPVTLTDVRQAARRSDPTRLRELEAIRDERFELMERMARLPDDTVLFTQITMEVAEDREFLEAMRRAHIKGALVGIESVTSDGLKSVFKGFNSSGEDLVARLRTFHEHKVRVLGSFIFGLPADRADTFEATEDLAERAQLTFAQFVPLTPFPGTLDFAAWEKTPEAQATVAGVPLKRYWLIPHDARPKVYIPHPTLSAAEIRRRTQDVWDRFYSLPRIWQRSCAECGSLRERLAFVLISKLYRQMYANTGIATDAARVGRATKWARLLLKPCRRLFTTRPTSLERLVPETPLPARPAPARFPALEARRSSHAVVGREGDALAPLQRAVVREPQ